MAAIGDRMEEEEERLAERARELRRVVLEIVNVAFGTFFKTKLNIFVKLSLLETQHNTNNQEKHWCVPVCHGQPVHDHKS